ncbi:MAG: hypothetical protein IPN42_06005 [Methylococcaceae bacterium]|nr:hypothetical protein [Methylococcaceae bacterium]
MTREKFYEDFLNHLDYLTAKAHEENRLYHTDADELERKLDEIKLFAPENVYVAAKKLFNYNLSHYRDHSPSSLAGFAVVRKQYIDATKNDIN